MTVLLPSLANLERELGDVHAARRHAADGVRIAHRGEFTLGLASALEALAFIALAEGNPFHAMVLIESARMLTARRGAKPERFPLREEAEQRLAEACARLADATLAQARELAAAMTVDEAVAYALSYADKEGVVDLFV